ncbi:hypothetical protein BD626DRAFT_248008 [Schizophyllum amplum]|uniref:C2H2-type domain-containing protein n=1 Tax=Schizophyllum amplum TaxID=97359 RepID=A0A550BV94_9AGAR|nr:hypothetical protein BD626DRAFT_248008 [Auriculariopsis ampla]
MERATGSQPWSQSDHTWQTTPQQPADDMHYGNDTYAESLPMSSLTECIGHLRGVASLFTGFCQPANNYNAPTDDPRSHASHSLPPTWYPYASLSSSAQDAVGQTLDATRADYPAGTHYAQPLASYAEPLYTETSQLPAAGAADMTAPMIHPLAAHGAQPLAAYPYSSVQQLHVSPPSSAPVMVGRPDAAPLNFREVGSDAYTNAGLARRTAASSGSRSNIVCDWCRKTFARPYNLYVHRQRHIDAKEFHCSSGGCSARFNARGDLRNHTRKVHKLPPAGRISMSSRAKNEGL